MLTITGPMRSGTSIVARIAQQLGISMGVLMRIPPPGSGLDPEYEDWWIADDLTQRALGIPVALAEPPFENYIGNRQRKAQGKPWGFKSPLLALYWSEWLAAAESCGEPVVTVVCSRDETEIQHSLARSCSPEQLPVLQDIHARIQEALKDVDASQDLVVPFWNPPSETAPQRIAAQLATLMGIESYDPEIAVRGIRT